MQLWISQEEGLQRFASYLCQRVSESAAQEYSRLVEAPGEHKNQICLVCAAAAAALSGLCTRGGWVHTLQRCGKHMQTKWHNWLPQCLVLADPGFCPLVAAAPAEAPAWLVAGGMVWG